MSGQTLISLVGSYDNLHELTPSWNQKVTILSVVIAFMALSWLCALPRLYVRLFVTHSPGWDDLFLTLYLLSTTLGSILLCLLTDWGLGKHWLTLSIPTMKGYLLRFWIANASYCMSTTLIKISLLFQYLRVFDKGLLRNVCISSIVLVSLWGAAYSVMAWTPCIPIHGFWDFFDADVTCYGYGARTADQFTATYESHTAFNMVFDALVFCIPVPLYFQANASSRTKKGLLVVFAMGLLVISISAVRLKTIIDHRSTTYPTFDPSWYSPISMVLAAMEVDIASICASVPVFWPLLRLYSANIFVTEEVEIRHETRPGYSVELDCRAKAASTTSKPSLVEEEDSGQQRQRSPQGSEIFFFEGSKTADVEPKTSNTTKHYEDEYVKKQVNPFITKKGSVDSWSIVEAQASSTTTSKKKGLQTFFLP
ncbi:hypothetical protein B0T26DRAFT_669574 [Lasiosphaeria miniovina]|uniref:Rhodopsin domain-containing protein n=1 Tax=Lasiosphaeria miniovina TaxID=1954250 RepID=A0AA40BF79_9PEZI|nr:uncharacterized protein B0T26DRAFT_669574 [Lasiosphaeria miniovina]KAK0733137.1 hypothetical protein B0T26DRAFT_669574 [Lasiosphaeria miniovina]